MGKKTHGSWLLHAIEKNNIDKVQEILGSQIRNKEKVKDICTAELKRLTTDHTDCPLLVAAMLPDPSIIEYMVRKFEVNINFVQEKSTGRRIKLKTPLLIAVRLGLYDTVEAMLSFNADPNFQDHKGRTALHHTIKRADYRMAKMLLTRGALANLTDKADNTPLHVTTIFGHVELAKLVIQYGGDVYKKGQHGAIPIHIAASEGHTAMIKLFCNNDVNPNIKVPCYDDREKAPLHVAAEQGHVDAVTTLIELHGADVNSRDSEGNSPLHCTVIQVYDPLGMKAKEDYAEAAKVLIRAGGDVNTQNRRGETAVHLAARHEFPKIVDLLVQAGADSLMEDNDGNKAIDLVSNEDTATKQLLKSAMHDRERMLSDLLEIQARGFSTSSKSSTSKSVSSASMPVLNTQHFGHTVSTPGLFHQPQPIGRGGNAVDGETDYMQPVGSQQNLNSNPTNAGHQARLDSTSSGATDPGPDPYAQIKDTKQLTQPARKTSAISSKSKPAHKSSGKVQVLASVNENTISIDRPDERAPFHQRRAVSVNALDNRVAGAQNRNIGRSLPKPPSVSSEVRESISDTTSLWDVSPRSSTSAYPYQGNAANYAREIMAKAKISPQYRYSGISVTSELTEQSYESLPVHNHIPNLDGEAIYQNEIPPVSNGLPSIPILPAPFEKDDDDSYFDDESFDTVSDEPPPRIPPRTAPVTKPKPKPKTKPKPKKSHTEEEQKKIKKATSDPKVQNWLAEQASLLKERERRDNQGPLAHSTPPSHRATGRRTPLQTLEEAPTESEDTASSDRGVISNNRNNKGYAKSGVKSAPPPVPQRDRNSSVSSVDSSKRRKPPPPPQEDKSANDQKVIQLEVDDGTVPGQTIIRIIPMNPDQGSIEHSTEALASTLQELISKKEQLTPTEPSPKMQIPPNNVSETVKSESLEEISEPDTYEQDNNQNLVKGKSKSNKKQKLLWQKAESKESTETSTNKPSSLHWEKVSLTGTETGIYWEHTGTEDIYQALKESPKQVKPLRKNKGTCQEPEAKAIKEVEKHPPPKEPPSVPTTVKESDSDTDSTFSSISSDSEEDDFPNSGHQVAVLYDILPKKQETASSKPLAQSSPLQDRFLQPVGKSIADEYRFNKGLVDVNTASPVEIGNTIIRKVSESDEEEPEDSNIVVRKPYKGLSVEDRSSRESCASSLSRMSSISSVQTVIEVPMHERNSHGDDISSSEDSSEVSSDDSSDESDRTPTPPYSEVNKTDRAKQRGMQDKVLQHLHQESNRQEKERQKAEQEKQERILQQKQEEKQLKIKQHQLQLQREEEAKQQKLKEQREEAARRQQQLEEEKLRQQQEEIKRKKEQEEEKRKLQQQQELKRQQQLKQEEEQRRQQQLLQQEEIRRQQQLKREEEERRQQQLQQQEELRRQQELQRQEELRQQQIKQKEEQRLLQLQQEEMKRQQLKKEEDRRRQQQLQQEEEIKRKQQRQEEEELKQQQLLKEAQLQEEREQLKRLQEQKHDDVEAKQPQQPENDHTTRQKDESPKDKPHKGKKKTKVKKKNKIEKENTQTVPSESQTQNVVDDTYLEPSPPNQQTQPVSYPQHTSQIDTTLKDSTTSNFQVQAQVEPTQNTGISDDHHISRSESFYEEIPDRKQRRVTIGSEEIIPDTPRRSKDFDHRTITYQSGGRQPLSIVGGNSDGIFVHKIEPNSDADAKGVLPGDQILKINGQSIKGKTHEEVSLHLMSLKNNVTLILRNKKDRCDRIVENGGMGDSFFVRAHFNFNPKQEGEMTIGNGDIFSVRETLPNGTMGYWRALKFNAGPNERQHGLIPNKHRAEQLALAERLAQSKAGLEKERGGIFRRSFRRSKSVDRINRDSDRKTSVSQGDIVAYERVEQKASESPRPVFLLGLFCDSVRDMLARDSPGLYEIPTEDVEIPTSQTAHGGVRDPVNIRVLKAISSQNKHCLTILSPRAIRFLQQNSEICPLVIYLSPGNKNITKATKLKLAPGFNRKVSHMYDEAVAFEKANRDIFTATVTYTMDDGWFSLLKDTINRIQNHPMWKTVRHSQQDSSDEESEDAFSEVFVNKVEKPPRMRVISHRTTDDIPDPLQNILSLHAAKEPHGEHETDLEMRRAPLPSLTYDGYFLADTSRSSVTSSRSDTSHRSPNKQKQTNEHNRSDSMNTSISDYPKSILKNKRSSSDLNSSYSSIQNGAPSPTDAQRARTEPQELNRGRPSHRTGSTSQTGGHPEGGGYQQRGGSQQSGGHNQSGGHPQSGGFQRRYQPRNAPQQASGQSRGALTTDLILQQLQYQQMTKHRPEGQLHPNQGLETPL